MADTPKLILASTSRYRRELLARLRLPFEVLPPEVDETPQRGEMPCALAMRLAREKARAVAKTHPQAVVIGADQVADLDGKALGKPGDRERATAQLRTLSGQRVVFHTALSVVRADIEYERSLLAPVTVRFRHLSDAEIDRYLELEQPFDCAGSARSEALGIALLEEILSDDPTALVGLPLIRTAQLLREAGLDPVLDAA